MVGMPYADTDTLWNSRNFYVKEHPPCGCGRMVVKTEYKVKLMYGALN